MTDIDKMPEIEKYIRDGKVAVLYSPDFGAGWSTWHWGDAHVREQMAFDPFLVMLVLNEASEHDIVDYVESKYDFSVLDPLSVAWVPVGKKFIITEYDGAESVQLLDEIEWIHLELDDRSRRRGVGHHTG